MITLRQAFGPRLQRHDADRPAIARETRPRRWPSDSRPARRRRRSASPPRRRKGRRASPPDESRDDRPAGPGRGARPPEMAFGPLIQNVPLRVFQNLVDAVAGQPLARAEVRQLCRRASGTGRRRACRTTARRRDPRESPRSSPAQPRGHRRPARSGRRASGSRRARCRSRCRRRASSASVRMLK